ncbi:hypothetical protein ABTE01_19370, partial [Acinetobacter baumannii]
SQYAQLQPASALNANILIDAVNVRLGAFAQNIENPASSQPVIDSLRTSVKAYDESTLSLVDAIDNRLADRTADVRGVVLRDIAI